MLQGLTKVQRACCAEGTCQGLLALDLAGPNPVICNSPGTYCDASGSLTHVNLASSALRCQLHEILSPLADLNTVTALHIDDNDVRGDLGSQQVLAGAAAWTGLRVLSMRALPRLSGALPQDCAPPFSALTHLALAESPVSGALPDCLVVLLDTLFISRTNIAGKFPVLAGSTLRCDTDDFPQNESIVHSSPSVSSPPRSLSPRHRACRVLSVAHTEGVAAMFSEPFPDLSGARQLQFFGARSQNFSGAAVLPASLRAIDIANNRCDNVSLAMAETPPQLGAALVSNNAMLLDLGLLAQMLTQLVAWHMVGNRIRRLPPVWASQRLHALDLTRNELIVRTCSAILAAL